MMKAGFFSSTSSLTAIVSLMIAAAPWKNFIYLFLKQTNLELSKIHIKQANKSVYIYIGVWV